jgi:hypothetical protein
MPQRWKSTWQPKGSGEQAQRKAPPVKLSKHTRPVKHAVSDMTSGLGGIQDQARDGKNRGRPRPHAGAGGARTPRTGQREPEGVPGQSLLPKGNPYTPKEPPDTRQNTQIAPAPSRTYQKKTRLEPRRRRGRRHRPKRIGSRRRGTLEETPRPDELAAEKLDSGRTSRPPWSESGCVSGEYLP